MSTMLGRLAAAATRHWKRSLAIVAAVLIGIAALSQLAGGSFSDEFSIPGTESQLALDLLEERFPARAGDTAEVVFSVEDGTLRDGDRPEAIAETVAEIAAAPHVTSAVDPLAAAEQVQVSPDGKVAFVTVQYDERAGELGSAAGDGLEEASAIAESAGVEVSRRGQVVDEAEQQEAPVGELVGVAVAIVALLLVFRSAAAMVITLVSAAVALAGGLMLLTLATAFTDFPSFAPTLGLMLGLGAGIDYALLIVGRHREQLAAGDSVEDAARVANSTAGMSVLVAGTIVVLAISGLLVTGIPFVGRMGVGSAIVVATVALGAITILPPMMSGAGRRLRPKRPRDLAPSRGSARWNRWLTGRPWLAAGAGTLILLVLATPALSLRLGQPDDGNDRPDSTTRVAYDTLAEGFGPGFNGPLVLAVSIPPGNQGQAGLGAVERAIAATPDVAAVAPPVLNDRGDAATITVIPASAPQDERTSELVTTLREDVLPAATENGELDVYVGGATAVFEDLSKKVADRLPVFIALVVGLSVLLLVVVFRSIWVPLVSAAFNLLSIAAAYGVVVAVFQFGWGNSLLGVDGEVPIISFVPLFMFAVLFGLSMDYNVFLQSRIREEYRRGASPRESVIRGLSRVARIILAAGVIMTGVFLGFVSDPEVIVKTIGLGLASAILIDVLVVRLLLAPAVMTLLGDAAWRLPPWLDRILPEVSLGDE
jgi:RND superfamily putative drug exporter